MHYRNRQPARLGDIAKHEQTQTHKDGSSTVTTRIGMLVEASPDSGSCNGRLTNITQVEESTHHGRAVTHPAGPHCVTIGECDKVA